MQFRNYAQSNAPKFSKAWKSKEIFKGYPSNSERVVSKSFNPEDLESCNDKTASNLQIDGGGFNYGV